MSFVSTEGSGWGPIVSSDVIGELSFLSLRMRLLNLIPSSFRLLFYSAITFLLGTTKMAVFELVREFVVVLGGWRWMPTIRRQPRFPVRSSAPIGGVGCSRSPGRRMPTRCKHILMLMLTHYST